VIRESINDATTKNNIDDVLVETIHAFELSVLCLNAKISADLKAAAENHSDIGWN
jgi:hypothetical protein